MSTQAAVREVIGKIGDDAAPVLHALAGYPDWQRYVNSAVEYIQSLERFSDPARYSMTEVHPDIFDNIPTLNKALLTLRACRHLIPAEEQRISVVIQNIEEVREYVGNEDNPKIDAGTMRDVEGWFKSIFLQQCEKAKLTSEQIDETLSHFNFPVMSRAFTHGY